MQYGWDRNYSPFAFSVLSLDTAELECLFSLCHLLGEEKNEGCIK